MNESQKDLYEGHRLSGKNRWCQSPNNKIRTVCISTRTLSICGWQDERDLTDEHANDDALLQLLYWQQLDRWVRGGGSGDHETGLGIASEGQGLYGTLGSSDWVTSLSSPNPFWPAQRGAQLEAAGREQVFEEE